MRLYTRIFITTHLYILTTIVCKNSAGELGDGYTSDQSRDGFFAELDNNANGQISLDELREVTVTRIYIYACILTDRVTIVY